MWPCFLVASVQRAYEERGRTQERVSEIVRRSHHVNRWARRALLLIPQTIGLLKGVPQIKTGVEGVFTSRSRREEPFVRVVLKGVAAATFRFTDSDVMTFSRTSLTTGEPLVEHSLIRDWAAFSTDVFTFAPSPVLSVEDPFLRSP